MCAWSRWIQQALLECPMHRIAWVKRKWRKGGQHQEDDFVSVAAIGKGWQPQSLRVQHPRWTNTSPPGVLPRGVSSPGDAQRRAQLQIHAFSRTTHSFAVEACRTKTSTTQTVGRGSMGTDGTRAQSKSTPSTGIDCEHIGLRLTDGRSDEFRIPALGDLVRREGVGTHTPGIGMRGRRGSHWSFRHGQRQKDRMARLRAKQAALSESVA